MRSIKVRCQCPAPVDGVLHFKAADRQCDKCGAAICSDCGVNVRREFPWPWSWGSVHWICSDCRDLLVEKSVENN